MQLACLFYVLIPLQLILPCSPTTPTLSLVLILAVRVQAFEKQLVPSVEKAMAEMFRQTDATLSAGLTEYARAAGSAATPTVKSLQAALTQVSTMGFGLLAQAGVCCTWPAPQWQFS